MQTRKMLFILTALSILGWGVGYVLTNSIKFGLCTVDGLNRDPSCINFYESIGDPLYYGMAALAFVFVVLLIFPVGYHTWKYFALWFVPSALVMFLFYERGGGSFLNVMPYPEVVYAFIAKVYVTISLIIIGISVIRKRSGKTKPNKPWSKNKKIVFWSLWVLYVALLFIPELYPLLRSFID